MKAVGLTDDEEDMGLFSSSSELSERDDSSHSLISFLMVLCCWSRYISDTNCTIVMFHKCCKLQMNYTIHIPMDIQCRTTVKMPYNLLKWS